MPKPFVFSDALAGLNGLEILGIDQDKFHPEILKLALVSV